MADYQSYSVNTFCVAEDISRGMLYKLWSQGKGPRYYLVGNVRRITPEAALNGSARAKPSP